MFPPLVLLTAAVIPASTSPSFHRSANQRLGLSGRGQLALVQETWQARTEHRGSEAPNLAEYCKGEEEFEKKDPVLANWKDYGTYYPGVVEDTNRDGTLDILYEDGWREDGVSKDHIKPVEKKENNNKGKSDDAACELAEDVEKVKDKLKDANKDIAVYLASKRAAAAGKQSMAPVEAAAPAPAAAAGVAAPAPATMSEANGEQAKKLQKLKEELSAVNAEITKEEAIITSNDEVLKDLAEQAPASVTQPKTVDDLIAEYIARIAERKEVLRKLRETRHKQEVQMAGMGKSSVSLEEMQKNIENIGTDMEEIKAKRDKLRKEDRLDDELRAAVDSMLTYGAKLMARVQALAKADKEAEARRKAAEEAAEEAAQLAAAKAEAEKDAAAEGETADHDAKEKAAAAKKEAAEKAASEAEAEVFKAGEEVEQELKSVSKETEMLDTGVHPHGDKWWRYRYEHSYVEAGLMILISLLLMFYVKFFNGLRVMVYERSNMRAISGTAYTRWLEYTSLQMLACLVVFLTIWLMDHCGVFDALAFHIHGNKFVRLPSAGKQYKQVAFDICVVLIIAFLFYFTLMLSVVHWTIVKMRLWAISDSSTESSNPGGEELPPSARMSLKKSLTFYGSADEFQRRKEYFLMHMTAHPTIIKKLTKPGDGKLDVSTISEKFPFWKYLRMNVRAMTDDLLELSTGLWIGINFTFAVLFVFHYFLHVGYIRIMGFFMLVQLSTLGLCAFLVYIVNSKIESAMNEDEDDEDKAGSQPGYQRELTSLSSARLMRRAYFIKNTVIDLLQYTLFFLCYGAGRSICQPWMWKLHFWLVLGATLFTVLTAIIFMVFIAPIMTAFGASMAMPPFLDMDNIAKMEEIIDSLNQDTMTSKNFMEVGKD